MNDEVANIMSQSKRRLTRLKLLSNFFENIDVLAAIPIHIVHGRFDEVCPLTQASRLVAALRAAGAEPLTYVVTNAGHSAMERDNALALTAVMDGLALLVRA